ncbi:hypothetical protein [uncultured Cyclobacterium sp.]|uniref:hypothetical protein n=1 Tax=uncultured Cyclobacterium sp. TaxID=453820 RepID=UPI0030EF442F|tara:strand:+ start:23197 stop:23793 length:597 start_codon:yes stop_codon:yes gene_type:complete
MLYIKFDIQDPTKFKDFQKLYAHMETVRQPGFKFEEEESPVIDWEKVTNEEEVNEALKKLDDFFDEDPAVKRYQKLIPDYVNEFLECYLVVDNDKLGTLGIQETLAIFNYIEFGFEVFFTKLENQDNKSGLIEYVADNFPYGGIDRFLMVLKAFDMIPTECFDGFTIFEFEWNTDFEYSTKDLPEKTKNYLKSKRNET